MKYNDCHNFLENGEKRRRDREKGKNPGSIFGAKKFEQKEEKRHEKKKKNPKKIVGMSSCVHGRMHERGEREREGGREKEGERERERDRDTQKT